MIHCFKKHNCITCKKNNRMTAILCMLLAMLSVAGLLFPAEKAAAECICNVSQSDSCSIKAVSDSAHPTALVKESVLTNPFANSVRIIRSKNTGYRKVTIRFIFLDFILALFSIFVALQQFYISQITGLIKQRLSIIIYIHNMDGRKRHYLSYIH